MGVTYVTVAHYEDFGMLHLQARSMDIYLDHDQVDKIYVVRNMVPVRGGKGGIYKGMYGSLQKKVQILDGSKLCYIPNVSGWFSQQILKMEIAKLIDAKSYVLLDAKNHLVFPVPPDFFSINGKIRMYYTDYRTHPLKKYLETSLRYFEINPASHVSFLPPVTPFVVDTDFARRLMKRIEQREQVAFPIAFIKLGITEFFSLNAFIMSCGYDLDEFYDISGRQSHVIWTDTIERYPNALKDDIARTEKDEWPFFSIHRGAFDTLSDKSMKTIATFWKRRGLFQYLSDGIRYLRDPNSFLWV